MPVSSAIKRALIRLLEEEGYAYLPIHDEAELIANLRTQLSALNDYDFTDAEWERFFKTSIAPASDGIAPKTRRIQTDYIQNLKRDDGTTKNIRLIDKERIHNNRLQVINQVSRFRPITFYDREEQEDGHHLVSLYQMGVWS